MNSDKSYLSRIISPLNEEECQALVDALDRVMDILKKCGHGEHDGDLVDDAVQCRRQHGDRTANGRDIIKVRKTGALICCSANSAMICWRQRGERRREL